MMTFFFAAEFGWSISRSPLQTRTRDDAGVASSLLFVPLLRQRLSRPRPIAAAAQRSGLEFVAVVVRDLFTSANASKRPKLVTGEDRVRPLGVVDKAEVVSADDPVPGSVAVFDPKNVRTVAPGRLAFVAAKKCCPGDPLYCKKTPSVNGAFCNDEKSVSLHFARLS